MTSLVRCTRRP